METMQLQQALQLAVGHHQAGRLDQAEAVYRQILQTNPNLPQALNLLGVLFHQRGQNNQAIELLDRAITLNPAADYYSNRGAVLRALKRIDEAISSFQAAIRIKPDYVDAHFNLASAMLSQMRVDEAIAGFRRVLQLQPQSARAYVQLGDALWQRNLPDEAIDAYRQAIRLVPNLADAHNNLGHVLQRLGRFDQAMESYRSALQVQPNLHGALYNIGNVLRDQARLDEAIECYRRAMAIAPHDPNPQSNLLYTLQFHPNYTDEQLKKEHEDWNRRHALPWQPKMQKHSSQRDPDRRLKIGYVSPDFYHHAECFFVVPLLENHNHTQFEVHCYSSVTTPDFITDRVRKSADRWHDVRLLSDAELADQIRRDQIDILIDLTMHMRGNRLITFAQKPAPVQMTWLAYPGSTGLTAIDYHITDRFMDLPDQNDSWCTEQAIHLPDCWCCYHPVTECPEVNSRSGPVTFGSLNNFCKTNDQVLRLWASVLNAVPDSNLILLSQEGSHRKRTLELFQSLGIAATRIEFVPIRPRDEYLHLYGRIDISLDPFPYNGITTTCDAMWMGVPVVALAGRRPAARAGLSLLNTIGLPEFVAHNEDDYVRIVTNLANDRNRLANLRSSLRERMRQSSLMDAPRFARSMENAYRNAWKHWCAT